MAKRVIICLTLMTVLAPVSFGADPAPGAEMQKPEWWVNTAIAIAKEVQDPKQKNEILRRVSYMAEAAGMFDEARRIIGEASMDLVQAQLKRGMIAEALRTAKEIPYPGTKDNAIALIVRAQAEAGQFADALATMDLIQDPMLKIVETTGVARAELKAGAPGAQKLLVGITKNERVRVLWDNLNAVLELQIQGGFLDDALATAKEFALPHQRVRALCSVGMAQAAAGKKDDAIKTFSDATALVESADEKAKWGLMSHIASSEASAGFIKEAQETIGRIEKPWVDVYAAVAYAQFKAGDKDAALKTFSDVVDMAKGYDKDGRASAFSYIAWVQIRCGLLEEALTNAEQSSNAVVIEKITEQYLAQSKFDEAVNVAAKIGDKDRSARALMQIAQAQAAAGKREDAAKTFAKAVDAAKEVINRVITDHIGNTHYFYERDGLLFEILKQQADAGLIEDALATARLLKDYPADSGQSYYHGHNFRQEPEAGLASTSTFASRAACVIALEQAKDGHYAEALDRLNDIEAALPREDAIEAVALMQAKAGLFDDAVATAKRIHNTATRALAVCQIAELRAQAGKTDAAARNFSYAVALMKQREDGVSTEGQFRAIALSMARPRRFGPRRVLSWLG